mgnify:CR=1 FL=1
MLKLLHGALCAVLLWGLLPQLPAWAQAVQAMRGTYQDGAGRLPIWKARPPDLWPEQPHAG